MYAYINGILDEIDNQRVVLEAQGVGYAISVPNSIIHRLPAIGERVKLYTYFNVREDGQELYGFIDKEEKAFFEKLITVSGIGPKMALGILSAYPSQQIAAAILTSDIKFLCTIPGIGKKTAERTILELKDKVSKEAVKFDIPIQPAAYTNERYEALEALQALGYPAADAEKALAGVEGEDSSALIRMALKNLASRGR